MIFSHEYTKLSKDEFTTIRMNTNLYKVGTSICIKTPQQNFRAKVIERHLIKKEDITDELANSDADCTKEDLIKKLIGWYGTEFNNFVLLKLRRLK